MMENEFEGTTWEVQKESGAHCWRVTTETEVHYVYARSIHHNHGAISFSAKANETVASYSPTGYTNVVKVDPQTKASIAVEVRK